MINDCVRGPGRERREKKIPYIHKRPNVEFIRPTPTQDFINESDAEKPESTRIAYYDERGDQFFIDAKFENSVRHLELNSLAKTISNGERTEYYVKYGYAGAEAGHLFDPWNPRTPYHRSSVHERTMGRQEFDWKRVNESVFHTYIHFLKTQNHAYLRIAERDHKNA